MIFAQVDNDATGETLLVIVIESDNLARMEKADPITLEPNIIGGYLKPVKYPNGLRMVIAYEKESGELYQMIKDGRDAELLPYLMRGYKFGGKDGKKAEKIRGQA